MGTRTVTLAVPQDLADDAQQFGLMEDQALLELIRAEVRRQHGQRLLRATEPLAKEPLTPAAAREIEAEIEAARADKRSKNAGGR